MDQDIQREYFTRAVDLLGGQQSAAKALQMSDRSLRYYLSGKRPLHAGIIADIATCLLAHAAACRQLEQRISPAFRSNLTEHQAERGAHPNSAHAKRQQEV